MAARDLQEHRAPAQTLDPAAVSKSCSRKTTGEIPGETVSTITFTIARIHEASRAATAGFNLADLKAARCPKAGEMAILPAGMGRVN